jgi:hypothetical protein
MRPRPDFALFAGLIATALTLGSCGGGSSPEALSQFRHEANQVCHDSQQQFDRIEQAQPRTAHQTEEQAAALANVSQQALDNLHQINPPDQLKAIWDRYLSARDKDLGYIQAGRDAAANSDIDAYIRATRQAAAQAAYRRQLALQLGLDLCSRPSVTLGKK